MRTATLKSAISCLKEGARDPKIWSEALPLLASALGGSGGACFARNDRTGAVEWAEIFGPASGRRYDYVEHYASLDLYMPVIIASPRRDWIALSKCLSESELGSSEWYQDFVKPSRIGDVLGIQLHQAGPSRIFFGIHYERTEESRSPLDADLQELLAHLQEAARITQVQQTLNLRASVGTWALDHLADALFVVSNSGRVIEMNSSAGQFLAGNRVLAITQGKLAAIDALEAERLAALIANASAAGARRLLLGGADHHRHCQLLTIYPLAAGGTPDEPEMVVIRAVDLLAQPSFDVGLADLFGLSPAEDRLARALVQGKTLQELTREFRVQMPTLRAQVRSVLRKCGVQRQVDLMRVLLRVH